jgi:hypothetical protein
LCPPNATFGETREPRAAVEVPADGRVAGFAVVVVEGRVAAVPVVVNRLGLYREYAGFGMVE